MSGISVGGILVLGLIWVNKPVPKNELLSEMEKIQAIVLDNYVDEIPNGKLEKGALMGMLGGLDPHSTYMEADDYKEFAIATGGVYGGLGLEVEADDGLIRVVSPMEDSPAAAADIRSGDLIVKINHEFVGGLTLMEAINKMRGKQDTAVELTITRKGHESPLKKVIIRKVITMASVKKKLVSPNTGYIRITNFQENTLDLVLEAINKLTAENKKPLTKMILDLRGNPGGLLTGAVGIAGIFLEKNTLVVETKGKSTSSNIKYRNTAADYGKNEDIVNNGPQWVKSVKLVVLVNHGSASASEIVAGALQDHKRATVVGVTTFGKGSVQTVMPVSNKAAIKLTTARYYTPSGGAIQAKGIEPDIKLKGDTSVNLKESQMVIKESDLNGHLKKEGSTLKEEPRDIGPIVKFADYATNTDPYFNKAMEILETGLASK